MFSYCKNKKTKKKEEKKNSMSFKDHHWEDLIRVIELRDESSFSLKTTVGTDTPDDYDVPRPGPKRRCPDGYSNS